MTEHTDGHASLEERTADDPYEPGPTVPLGRVPEARPLSSSFATSWIEVDGDALAANARQLRALMGPDVTLVSVVKGNAYGHGYDPVVPILEAAGQRHFAVFSAAEAAAFRAVADPGSVVQVMGHVPPEATEWVLGHACQPWIGTPDLWPRYHAALDAVDAPVGFHLEVETGMNRMGLTPNQIITVASEIADHPMAQVQGLCTHLAGAEDHHNQTRIARQKKVFADTLGRLAEIGIEPHDRHLASSSAAILDPDARGSMVRVGIAAYGFWPTGDVFLRYQGRHADDRPLTLKRALTWRSRIMHILDVADGEHVGYGRTYQAEGAARVAIVPVGYAEGFSRALGNNGHVLIGGRRSSIIGHVNMNMIQVNVTHLHDVAPGDEVVLIGRQGRAEITVSSFADYNQVVNYELMARLPIDIPRLRTGEAQPSDAPTT